MSTLTGDQAFVAVLVVLFFMYIAYAPTVRRWLHNFDPLSGLDRPPKKEE